MSRQLYVRIVSASGFAALAALFVVVDPFLSVGASLSNQMPAVSVNRSLKGDRLSINPTVVDVPDGRAATRQDANQRTQIPFACDAAVSVIRSAKAAPPSADVYRRCMA
jgi:hypothetical protein